MTTPVSPEPKPLPEPAPALDTALAQGRVSRNGRWVLAAMIALGGVGLAAAVGAARREVKPAEPKQTISADPHGVTLTEDAPQWKYVELAVAKAEPPLTPLPAPARVDLDPRRTANVGAPLAGRVESVGVRLGDAVKKGDRLFSVRSAAFADLDRELASAREEVAVKARLHERARELLELKATSEKEVLAAAAERTEAELALKAATAKRHSLSVATGGDNLFWVTAPRDGTVVEVDLFGSQEVGPDREKPLLRLSSLDEVVVVADVQEADAADLRDGMAVQILPQHGGEAVPGAVEHVSQVVDPVRRTVEVRVRAPNPKGTLRPNAFVQVALQPDPENSRVRVPAEAVVSEGSRSLVFIARGGGRLESVPVELGRQRDGEAEIRSGLTAGTRFVSRGALLLLNQIDLVE